MTTTTVFNMVYLGFDNELKVELSQTDVDGVVSYPNFAAITKMSVFFLEKFYDSEDNAGVFDWVTYAADHIVGIKLGLCDTLVLGKDTAAELIVYDPSHPDGIVWDTLAIKVVELVEPVVP
jgi:hypothetical protein